MIFFNYIAPVLVIPFSTSLSGIVLMLVCGRIISFFLHFGACIRILKDLTKKISFNKAYISYLLNFGGWITLSGIITPLMGYMDRFFVSGMLSASVVVYYTTPYDVVTKLSIVSNAIIAVMFPAFGTCFVQDKVKTFKYYKKTINYIFFLLIIPVLCIILFSKSALSIWLNADFASKSFQTAQLLALGIMINSLNHAPYALIQATGRSDITGKLHLAQLPVYLLLLWITIKTFGLIGAPLTYLLKVLFDAFFLHKTASKLLK